MKKIIVGLIGQTEGFDNDDSLFKDRYYFLDNYSQKIVKNGGIPLGIVMNNLKLIDEVLELCDCFVITGGSQILDYHVQIIDYALKTNKPLLGICCGMQAMAVYDHNDQLLEVLNHDFKGLKSNSQAVFHQINIKKNSILANIFKTNKLMVNSYHQYKITNQLNNFWITAVSEDGVIEAIEHKEKWLIGVQWHPEVLNNMDVLFKELFKQARKYKNDKC